MIDWLKEVDTKLFFLVNSHYCSCCDFIFYWISEKWVWIPLYIFLAVIIYKNYSHQLWKILVSIAVLILLTDQFSVFIKNWIMRYRPCHNLILQSQIHLVNGECGGQYGFISSHAANTAGLSLFLILLLRQKIKWIPAVMIAWCFIISYSRIYLGMHYPLDIVGGWVAGVLSAFIIYYFYKNYFIPKEKLKTGS